MRPRDKIGLCLRHLDNLAASGYWFERALAPELRRFATRPGGADAVAVDFGCGLKPLSRHLAGFRGACWGVDVYPGEKVDVVYDGRRLPFADASVDLLFSSSVFEHVRELEPVLREIARVLKPGGRMAAVVPFVNHVHGAPFDYHRPTRFGWAEMVAGCFGRAEVEVRPVDDRFTCLVNMATGQINFVLYDLARALARGLGYRGGRGDLAAGGASPEGGRGPALRAAYLAARLNPVNFLLGALAWAVAGLGPERPAEGEITSGYLIVVVKEDGGT